MSRMARLELSGFDDLNDVFNKIADIPWPVTDNALQAMASVEKDKVKEQGERAGIRDEESSVHILDKLKVNKSKKDSAGGHADVTFSGTRTRGKGKKTRNAEIAFVNEFGKEGQAARPFVKNAVENFADEITAPGEKVIGDWLENEWEK